MRLAVSPKPLNRVRNSHTAFWVAIDQKALCTDFLIGHPRACGIPSARVGEGQGGEPPCAFSLVRFFDAGQRNERKVPLRARLRAENDSLNFAFNKRGVILFDAGQINERKQIPSTN